MIPPCASPFSALLGFLLCLFLPARAAAAHLHMKWNSAGDKVKTAREFIERIGTKSSTSGKPYLVRDREGVEKPLGPWLTAALDAFDSAKVK